MPTYGYSLRTFCAGADAARHRLSQLPNVHLNGLNVIRMVDGRDHYFWTSACKAHDMAPGI
jgi:hypothetical protein